MTLSLSYDELLVLSDLLDRWVNAGSPDSLPFQDQSERRVLWDLGASLEPLVEEALSPNYGEAVAAARAALRDPVD